MFHSIKRILNWAGEYRRRLYLGCLCSFLAVWCSAIPVFIAVWALNLVLEDQNGIRVLEWKAVGLSLSGILAAIFLRYFFLTGKRGCRKALAMKWLQRNG